MTMIPTEISEQNSSSIAWLYTQTSLSVNRSKWFRTEPSNRVGKNVYICAWFLLFLFELPKSGNTKWKLSCTLKHFLTAFLIGIHSMKGWTATTRHGVTRKRNTKRLRHTGN